MEGRFELFRPFVLMPEADRPTGVQTPTIVCKISNMATPIQVVSVDWTTQAVTLRETTSPPQAAAALPSAPRVTTVPLSAFLRSIDIQQTGPMAWDGITPRHMASPPQGVTFPHIPPPPPPERPPPPPTVDISENARVGDLAFLRQYVTGLQGFGEDVDWESADFLHLTKAVRFFTTRLTLTDQQVLGADMHTRETYVARADALLRLKYSQALLSATATFTSDMKTRM